MMFFSINYLCSNRPNGQLVTDVVAWTQKKKNFTVFGVPWQADAQLCSFYNKLSWVQHSSYIIPATYTPASLIHSLSLCLCVCVSLSHTQVKGVISEDSDNWTMGVAD